MKDITGVEGFYSTYEGIPKYLNSEIYVNFTSIFDQLWVEERNDYELLSAKIVRIILCLTSMLFCTENPSRMGMNRMP